MSHSPDDLLIHEHLILRALVNEPFQDVAKAKAWLVSIIEGIGMKVAQGLEANPIGYYCNLPGNVGLTAAGILETSHVVIHIWDQVRPAKVHFDLYSCSHFTIDQIVEYLKPLGIVELRGKFLDREKDLPLLEFTDEKIAIAS
jgi:S-adenosylmethionine/arginine decarboxylase-like enzyme